MPCYMCKSKTGPFQRLEISRLRFIRKAQPLFRDDSYLCPKCFKQFETIYKSKSKSRNDSNSSRPSISNASLKSVSSNSHQSKSSSNDRSTVSATVPQKSPENNNNNSDNTSEVSLIHIDSRSMDTPSSIDSTDRIVQLSHKFLSIRDSTRKTTKNPSLNVAREQAEGAVEIGALHQTEQPETTPPSSNDGSPPLINFESGSMNSSITNDTIDKIVQMEPNFITLRDSSRKTTRNPEINIARQKAEAAVPPTSKRPRIRISRSDTTPPKTPSVGRRALDIVDEESSQDEDLASSLSPNNLAHVRPIVKRRKQPAVQQFDDIMDLYIARTSGG